jgi:hypothetical protein
VSRRPRKRSPHPTPTQEFVCCECGEAKAGKYMVSDLYTLVSGRAVRKGGLCPDCAYGAGQWFEVAGGNYFFRGEMIHGS